MPIKLEMPLRVKILLLIFSCFFGIPGIFLLLLALKIGHGMTLLMAMIFCLIGWFPLYWFLNKNLIKKRVLKVGVIVETTYVSSQKASSSILGWQPYIVKTKWHDIENNRLYFFKSTWVSGEICHYLKTNMFIPVYIDPLDPKKNYFMDLSPITLKCNKKQ
ncbi:hypothetical protein MMG00_05425 [Ignatzschineria rhizosphaerae]|uniref:DUF3592 domain-containing protein n=1 Tax=Ignatzschineria rhizosphaerae TaxID=2923279 RepID=A0ABY3X752_9GAMM|nr:hypothetical protein [Ignatzschineria rhizosphaerae]UNM97292.1 hypothetical protein MMG00_05425 [Ignatzschineria rhizosphaerae]